MASDRGSAIDAVVSQMRFQDFQNSPLSFEERDVSEVIQSEGSALKPTLCLGFGERLAFEYGHWKSLAV
jgi:hypothetical protein